MASIPPKKPLELQLSEQGRLARELLLNDLKLLEAYGAAPVLNIIKHYERDEDFPLLPTDVYSYHVGRSPVIMVRQVRYFPMHKPHKKCLFPKYVQHSKVNYSDHNK